LRRKRPPARSATRSLVRLPAQTAEASEPERELALLLERLTDLESATASLSESLARFRDERRGRLGPAEEELFAAKRFDARVIRLRTEAGEWEAGFTSPVNLRARRKPSVPGRPPPPLLAAPVAVPAAEPWVPLRDLYRTLVRATHPDLAKTEAERARKSELLARVNAAYAREDRVLLELLYAQASSPLEPREVELDQRASHVEKRLATLGPLVSSLEKELGRLRASSLFRDLEAMHRAAEDGGDYFEDALARIRRESTAFLTQAFERALELEGAVRAFPRRDRPAIARNRELLLRKAVARLGKARATEDAIRLESELRRRASSAPWQVALSVFAFFAEVSVEPPPGLSTLAAARDRYERLRVTWSSAPPFERAITELPPFLELGLRAYPKRLGFGLQMKHPWALGTAARALCTPELSGLARRVLEVMGPSERCSACGKVSFLVHLFRTRGMDEVHGLVCPACAAIQRSYRTFGAPLGLEALAPHAVALGLVDEQAVRIADATIVLGFEPKERKALTAKHLLERIALLHFDGPAKGLLRHARLRVGKAPLSPSAPVQKGAKVRLVLARGAPLGEKELVRVLRAEARARYSRGPSPDAVIPRSRGR
jgi:hypothetical protein